MNTRTVAFALAALLSASSASNAATFQFRFNDGPGEGFNDPTTVTPVGGNTATTLGAARRAVLQEAGRIWGGLLQSDVPIIVDAVFDPDTCSQNSGTLGSAGATTAFSFPTDPAIGYVSALADARAGRDIIGETANPTRADINSRFNSAVNGSVGCLNGATFYLGFDHNRGTRIDLLAVALHELGHGLGFIAGVDLTTGDSLFGPGVFFSFATQIFDEQSNQSWPLLSSSERVQSATRAGSLAYNGTSVRNYRTRLAGGVTSNGRVRLFAPNPVVAGSSVSHWDIVATPNLLMEPNISGDLTSRVDFTTCALRDAGWTVTRCPDLANAAPTIPVQTISVIEDTARTLPLVGIDTDNDPLTFTVVTNPTRGTLSGTFPTLTYTPNANLNGNDTFTVTTTDGIDTSAVATIALSVAAVNDAPSAAPTTATVQAGQSVNIPGLGADIDGDALTYSVVTAPSNGTAVVSGGNITYTANGSFSGTDTFTYRSNDPSGGSSAPASVTVTVTAPPRSGGGGGGGNMGVVFVALLSAAAFVRRRNAGK